MSELTGWIADFNVLELRPAAQSVRCVIILNEKQPPNVWVS